jgi:hypothetical protein
VKALSQFDSLSIKARSLSLNALLAIELCLLIFTTVMAYYIVDWSTNATYIAPTNLWTLKGHEIRGSQIKMAYALASLVCLELYVPFCLYH